VRGRAGRGRKSAPSTVSFPVQATSVGAVTANQFTGWTHGAGSIFTSGSWGASTKYFIATSDANLSATSNATSRDHEVTFWASLGSVYLRVLDNKALRFRTNINGGGGWTVAYVGIGSSGYESDTVITELGSGTPSGLNTSATASDLYVFGVSGFDVYVKWNGVEQWREKQLFAFKPGKVGLRTGADAGYGFRSCSVEFKASAALNSTPEFNILDVRDFGVKALATTGSMTAASTTLTVASNPGFAIGDPIIVEIGGESGVGARGTRGVGGQWPALSYANAAARAADTSQVTNKLAAQLDTGVVYKWSGSAWSVFATSGFFDLMLPRALIATITNISGTTFTLDTAATVSTTSANVYYNAAPTYAEILGAVYVNLGSYMSDLTIEWPAGNFAWGVATTALSFGGNRVRWNVRGQGVVSTTIFSPKGTLSLDLNQEGWAGPSVCHDIEFTSNCLASGGYQFRYNGTTDVPVQGNLVNIGFTSCSDISVYDVRATDWNSTGVLLSYCSNSTANDIEITHATGHREYTAWALILSNSSDCSATNVTIDSDYFTAGFEQFQCTDCTFTNITGRNTFCAVNSSGDWRYIGINITLETGAADASYLTWHSSFSPVVNINSNIDNQQGGDSETDGGVFSNFHLVQQTGFRSGVVFSMINVDGTGDYVTIQGQFPDKPNTLGLIELPAYSSGTANGIRDDSSTRNILIDGVRVIGTNSGGPDIGAGSSNATITNCVAETITTPGTRSNNINNAAYNAL
jgi:hypothetical protein